LELQEEEEGEMLRVLVEGLQQLIQHHRSVAEDGAAATSSIAAKEKSKEKRIVPTVEK
jgi:hypothetical protein